MVRGRKSAVTIFINLQPRKREGALLVTADSHGEDTYGALWDSRTAKYLIKKGDGNGDDFKITYDIKKGTTYYIGAREYDGDAIEGKVTLYVNLISNQLPGLGVTGQKNQANLSY